MDANRPLYECLIRMRNLPEMAPFKAMLDKEIVHETTMMASLADEKAMWRAQGAYRALTKLKNLIEDANKVFEKERPSNVLDGTFSQSNSP